MYTMCTSQAESLRDDRDPAAAQRLDAAPQSLPLPNEDWPEQAVDACALEGAYWFGIGLADVDSTAR